MGKFSCSNHNSFLKYPSGPCLVIYHICRKGMFKNQVHVSYHKWGTVTGQHHDYPCFINSNWCPKWEQELVNRLMEWDFNSLSEADILSQPHRWILLFYCWPLHSRNALKFKWARGLLSRSRKKKGSMMITGIDNGARQPEIVPHPHPRSTRTSCGQGSSHLMSLGSQW